MKILKVIKSSVLSFGVVFVALSALSLNFYLQAEELPQGAPVSAVIIKKANERQMSRPVGNDLGQGKIKLKKVGNDLG
jgi:hypothetical protein